ncbi:hypothetical protein ACX0G9_08410 [Flavitalea flava]
MKKQPFLNDWRLVLLVFIFSRLLFVLTGVEMDYGAIFRNWQYLDMATLQTNLGSGVWYDHTQPPVFNLFLGIVLKFTGSYARITFVLVFKLITLANTLLLLTILQQVFKKLFDRIRKDRSQRYAAIYSRLPLLFSLVYLLSPATLLFENELFYTSFITGLLLTSCLFLQRFSGGITGKKAIGFFLPLILICLTRSMYHLVWLFVLSALAVFFYRKQQGPAVRYLVTGAILSLLLVGFWYVKNLKVFGSFSTSTWMGMNIARNVFHDVPLTDSSRIAFIEPFSKISAYTKFLPAGFSARNSSRYGGLNDRDLLGEMKNDTCINEKNVGYLEVSKLYMEESKQQIKAHPGSYLKNVLQSAIIFFAPATRYPPNEYQAAKIKYYDVAYSFNLSHFAKGKQQRRIALTLSAFPKILLYLFVFFWMIRKAVREKMVLPLNLFITAIIAYIFCVSSLFEHFENMRFRYEAEPLFLILAAQVAADLIRIRQENKPVVITA